jgi:hypothetical protein
LAAHVDRFGNIVIAISARDAELASAAEEAIAA